MPNRDNLKQVLSLGIDYDDARALRRISMTLRRWHDYECGTGEGQTQYSIERDENGRPFMRVQRSTRTGYIDQRWPVPDRERGALKRLASIMARYPALTPYVQGDPRGCALHLLRPGDVPPGGDPSAYYSRGIPVY